MCIHLTAHAYLKHTDYIACCWRLCLLEATTFIGRQYQWRTANGSHFAVQVQGMSGSISRCKVKIMIYGNC